MLPKGLIPMLQLLQFGFTNIIINNKTNKSNFVDSFVLKKQGFYSKVKIHLKTKLSQIKFYYKLK